MRASLTEQVLLILNVPPGLEEPVVDWLLEQEHFAGFTSMSASGHSAQHEGLTTAEQVSGRQRRVQFQVHMASEHVSEFVAGASEAFGKADVHYWALPILECGPLRQPNEAALSE